MRLFSKIATGILIAPFVVAAVLATSVLWVPFAICAWFEWAWDDESKQKKESRTETHREMVTNYLNENLVNWESPEEGAVNRIMKDPNAGIECDPL